MPDEWAAGYIGKPWRNGARGPDAFDCWGLVTDVFLRVHGVTLPLLPLDATDAARVSREIEAQCGSSLWKETLTPGPGTVVVMGQGDRFNHVGLWLPESKQVLHASERKMIVAQRLSSVRRGQINIKFFNYVPNHPHQ